MIATPVTEYAAAVRAALADVPEPDRAELLEDLEDHLAEIAADTGGPLEDRLGPPKRYAAELRAAYTDAAPVKPRITLGILLDRLERNFADLVEQRVPDHPAVRTALRDARPVWWVVRGYLTAYMSWSVLDGDLDRFGPPGLGELLWAVVLVVLSVWLGQRARQGLPRRFLFRALTVLLTLGAAWAALLLLVSLDRDDSVYYSYPSAETTDPNRGLLDLQNLYVYDKNGKPLKDVLVYDQNGKPVTIYPTGLNILPGHEDAPGNAYPKALCTDNPDQLSRLVPMCWSKNDPGSPDVMLSPWLTPSPTATAKATPSTSP